MDRKIVQTKEVGGIWKLFGNLNEVMNASGLLSAAREIDKKIARIWIRSSWIRGQKQILMGKLWLVCLYGNPFVREENVEEGGNGGRSYILPLQGCVLGSYGSFSAAVPIFSWNWPPSNLWGAPVENVYPRFSRGDKIRSVDLKIIRMCARSPYAEPF